MIDEDPFLAAVLRSKESDWTPLDLVQARALADAMRRIERIDAAFSAETNPRRRRLLAGLGESHTRLVRAWSNLIGVSASSFREARWTTVARRAEAEARAAVAALSAEINRA